MGAFSESGWKWSKSLRALARLAIAALVLLAASPAQAQLPGDVLLGQSGLAVGTQAPEGLVVAPWFYVYHSKTIVRPDGNSLPGTTDSLTAPALVLSFEYVSPRKILGANYGAAVAAWVTASRVDFPRLDVDSSSVGFGDMYLQPVQLGWKATYVDVKTGFALWIPTGRYTPGGKDNSGQGQWGYEPTLGVTVWFDKDRHNRHLNLATMAFYDLYSPRRGTIGPSDTKLKTGNILTLMGGLGYQLRKGRLNIGVPYWAQWKVTEDRLPPGVGPILPGIQAAKDRSFGVGGETDFNWNPTNGITLRFFQGFGGINTTTGQSFFFFYHHIFGAQGGP